MNNIFSRIGTYVTKHRLAVGVIAGAIVLSSTVGGILYFDSKSVDTITAHAEELQMVEMYRLYNPNSGEHFYTADENEKNTLSSIGWSYEGIGWTAPKSSAVPVYRLYNPNSGEHHYTTGEGERDSLTKIGWNYEGIGWYSDEAKGIALHRLYNPNAKGETEAGAHHYTTDENEKNTLNSIGWNYEGIAWYGVDKNAIISSDGGEEPSSESGEETPTGNTGGSGSSSSTDSGKSWHNVDGGYWVNEPIGYEVPAEYEAVDNMYVDEDGYTVITTDYVLVEGTGEFKITGWNNVWVSDWTNLYY